MFLLFIFSNLPGHLIVLTDFLTFELSNKLPNNVLAILIAKTQFLTWWSPTKGNSNFKQTAKDILITSQLRTALIFNKKTKARNYTLETINKKIYIFGIAMDNDEKKEVLQEAEKIYDVEKVIPSIYLASELSRNKI